MFIATAVSPLDGEGLIAEIHGVGVFPDEQSAVETISDNNVGLQYDLVVIEEVDPSRLPSPAQWFRREPKGDYYYPLSNPPNIRPPKASFWEGWI